MCVITLKAEILPSKTVEFIEILNTSSIIA